MDPNIHNGLSGQMTAKKDHFEADGIPATPVDDNSTWNPYQVAEITVKDSSGVVLAQTRATVPTSDEINCKKCHNPNDPFNDILAAHDRLHGTNLVNQKPVVCASCHGSPALGQNGRDLRFVFVLRDTQFPFYQGCGVLSTVIQALPQNAAEALPTLHLTATARRATEQWDRSQAQLDRVPGSHGLTNRNVSHAIMSTA